MWAMRSFQVGDVLPGPDQQVVRLVRLIAEGGFSVVYEGVLEPSGTPCAVKALRLKHTDNPRTVERLLREGKALYALRHQNVVPVYFIGMRRDDHLIYLVMKLLRGRNLRELQHDLTVSQRSAQGDGQAVVHARLPVTWVLEIAMQMCSALDAIHTQAHAIHRDLKPENTFVEDDGGVWLFDIGSAKFPKETRLTTSNVTIGTVQYMSPEQLNTPDLVDFRSDLFALGVILYELLSGSKPFEAADGETNDAQAVGIRIIFNPHVSLRQRAPHLPGALVDIVERLLSKKRGSRPSSAAAVRELLAAAHAAFVKSLGALAPLALAQAIREIPRTASHADPAPRLSLPTSANPFVTVSLPPDAPAEGPAQQVSEAAEAASVAQTQEVAKEARTEPVPILTVVAAQDARATEPSAKEHAAWAAATAVGVRAPPDAATASEPEGPTYVLVEPAPESCEAAHDDGQGPSTSASPTAQGRATASDVELLRNLIAQLPYELRRPFVLNQIHGKSAEEIAELTGVPPEAVRARVLEARTRLGAAMDQAARGSPGAGVLQTSPQGAVAARPSQRSSASPSPQTRSMSPPPQRVGGPARRITAKRVAALLGAAALMVVVGLGVVRWRGEPSPRLNVALATERGAPTASATLATATNAPSEPTHASPESTSTPSPESTSTPSPEPTSTPSPEPTSTPSPEPTSRPSAAAPADTQAPPVARSASSVAPAPAPFQGSRPPPATPAPAVRPRPVPTAAPAAPTASAAHRLFGSEN
jgi:serine/threonine-protein kinase